MVFHASQVGAPGCYQGDATKMAAVLPPSTPANTDVDPMLDQHWASVCDADLMLISIEWCLLGGLCKQYLS